MKRIITAVLVCLVTLGGGGGSGGSGSIPVPSTARQAQRVFTGTASSGYTFDTIIPNDKYYAIYGTTSGNLFLGDGMLVGQGASANGSFNASVTDWTGAKFTGSLPQLRGWNER
jgi:hypothetical protein